jgi:hypothetical protein
MANNGLSFMRFIVSLQNHPRSQQPTPQLTEASCAAQRSVFGRVLSLRATMTIRKKILAEIIALKYFSRDFKKNMFGKVSLRL